MLYCTLVLWGCFKKKGRLCQDVVQKLKVKNDDSKNITKKYRLLIAISNIPCLRILTAYHQCKKHKKIFFLYKHIMQKLKPFGLLFLKASIRVLSEEISISCTLSLQIKFLVYLTTFLTQFSFSYISERYKSKLFMNEEQ